MRLREKAIAKQLRRVREKKGEREQRLLMFHSSNQREEKKKEKRGRKKGKPEPIPERGGRHVAICAIRRLR